MNGKVKTMDDHRMQPTPALDGLRVAVTGGTSGLGRALVRELRARHAHVAFVARDETRGTAVLAEERGTLGVAGDVSDKRAIHPIAMQLLPWRGGLHVRLNNASSLGP